MAPTTISLEVTNDHSVPVEPLLGGTVTVLNVSGDILYYADNSQVSAASNQGSLTAGNSTTVATPQWLRSAGLSTVAVTVNDPTTAGGSVTASTTYTGAPAALPGQTRGVHVNASGTVAVVNEALNAVAEGYLAQNSSSDQHTGVQSALTAVGNALGGRGGKLRIPEGVYRMGSGSVAYPSGSNQQITVEGDGGRPSYAYEMGGTKLQWDADIAPTGQLQPVTWGLDMTHCAYAALKNVAFKHNAPPYGTPSGGYVPANLAAIRAGGSSFIENVSVEGFHSALGYGGSAAMGQASDAGGDHTTLRQFWVSTCGFGIWHLPAHGGNAGVISGGDQRFQAVDLASLCGGIVVAASCPGFNGNQVSGMGFYCPVGILMYDDGSGDGGGNLIGNSWMTPSFEYCYDAAVFDERYLSGTHAQQYGNTWSSGPYQSPAATLGWHGSFTVSSQNNVASQITVQDTNGGFVFRNGMTVTGDANIPAGATITGISYARGAWPAGVNGLVTLTLSAAPTGTVIGALTIAWPKIAAFVMGAINNEFFSGNLMSSITGYPLVYGGNTGVYNIRGTDSQQALALAQSSPLLGGTVFPGTRFGNADEEITGGRMASGQSCSAGDVLMTSAAQPNLLQRADGTRFPVGVAIRAAASLGCVDCVSSLNTSGTSIVVNNKTGGVIAGNALLKVDTTNVGGVVAATSLTDGPPIGTAGSGGIAATASGSVRQLRF